MKVETKVGLLFILTIGLVVGFSYYLGAFASFSSGHTVHVTYNFAGGIETGSAVRVMGIKVGKVKTIHFDPTMKDKDNNEVKLKITLSLSDKAWEVVKEDSKFHINLAGVIGQKFIEISPGSASLPKLEEGAVVRGEDPPRIDQLISQSYGLAGKMLDMVEKNEGSVVDTIKMMNNLVSNTNKLLKQAERLTKNKKVNQLMTNIVQITGDIASVSGRLRSEDTGKTIDLVHELVWRLDDLDKKAIKKFLQEEGVKARIGL